MSKNKWERREQKKRNGRKMRVSGKGTKRAMLDLYWKRQQEAQEQGEQ